MTDYMYLPWPPWAGGTTKNRNDPISVELPKAPKVTVTVTGVIVPNFAKGNIIKALLLVNMPQHCNCLSNRHLTNKDCLMARTACLVCFISTVNGCSKKKENALEDVPLVAGTQQNLSKLYSLDIYGLRPLLSQQ